MKPGVETSFRMKDDPHGTKSPMMKVKEPSQVNTYPKKSYGTGNYDSTYTPTKSYTRGSGDKELYQRASEKDVLSKASGEP